MHNRNLNNLLSFSTPQKKAKTPTKLQTIVLIIRPESRTISKRNVFIIHTKEIQALHVAHGDLSKIFKKSMCEI